MTWARPSSRTDRRVFGRGENRGRRAVQLSKAEIEARAARWRQAVVLAAAGAIEPDDLTRVR